jgi:hypothetical protein
MNMIQSVLDPNRIKDQLKDAVGKLAGVPTG